MIEDRPHWLGSTPLADAVENGEAERPETDQSGYATIGALTAAGLPEEDVEVPGVGWVRVRGLTRREGLKVQEAKALPEKDVAMLVPGMVKPQMTRADVEAWRRTATVGAIEKVSYVITRLSGMLDDSAKESYKSDGDESDPGV